MEDIQGFFEKIKAERSVSEIIVFRAIEGILLIARFLAIIYFMMQAIQHFRHHGDKKDPYTFWTFFFLGFSLICFFINRLSQLAENTVVAIYQDDPEATANIQLWLSEHEMLIRSCRAMLRAGFGYLFQNLSFPINIQRWNVILSGGSTVND